MRALRDSRTLIASLAILGLLAAACAGDAASTTTQPSATTEAPVTTTGSDETTTTSADGTTTTSPPELTEVTVAIAGGLAVGSLYWDVAVALSEGYFEENGLEVEPLNASGGPDTVQAVVGGSAEFGVGATDAIVRGINQDAPISLIAGGALPPHALVVAPEITSYEDLRGERIAVTSVTAGSTLLLLELLAANDLAEEDFEFVLSGATPERLAAITSGAVSGTVLSPPSDRFAQEEGLNILGYVSEAADFVFIGHFVSNEFEAENPQLVVGYADAILRANRFIMDPANREAAIAALVEHSGADQEDAEATYETVVVELQGFAEDARITDENFRGLLDIIERDDDVSGLETDMFFDGMYLEEASN